MMKDQFFIEIKKLSKEILHVYITLMKIMIPVVLIFKALELAGAVHWLAMLISPVMALVGLPDAMGLVWATTMVTNIYAGMIVFYELVVTESLTVAQISTLGVMMLMAHSLPVEVAIAKKAGVKVRATLLLRIGSALLLGIVLNQFYSLSGASQEQSVMLWQPVVADTSLWSWAGEQLKTYIMIFVIIASLMTVLKILQLLGVERLMHALMSPLLRLFRISNSAADTTIIGVTLGLRFGGALLINEAKSGRLSKRDICLSLGFLALCHSLIEDTILIMLLGADVYVVLWGRLIFSLVIVGIIARGIYRHDNDNAQHWFMTKLRVNS